MKSLIDKSLIEIPLPKWLGIGMEILFFAFVWCFPHQQIKKRLKWIALSDAEYSNIADCPKVKKY